MTQIRWADKVGCDYPRCPATAEVQLPDNTVRRVLPTGWADFDLVTLMDTYGTRYREFCPQHAQVSLAEISKLLAPNPPAESETA